MRYVLPVILLLSIVACRNTTQPAQNPANPAGAAAAPKAGDPPPASALANPPAKPLPEQLPAVIARVNGEAITKTEFEQAVQSAEQQNGGPVPAERRSEIFRGILDQMIGVKLLQQETKARKVAVPDADVNARIAGIKQQFPTEQAFQQALAERKLTVEKITADARTDMAINKLIEDAVAAKVGVKPEDIQAFYTQNPQNFQQGEQVRASHILIGAPREADAATRAKAKAKAEQVLKDVKAGRDFAELARTNSEDPGSAAQGGDLGFFQSGQMVGPFNDVAFSLKPGTVSSVVETDFGFHIIKVVEKKPGRTVPLEEARPQIQQFLEQQGKQKEADAFVKGLRTKGKVEIFI
jgi:peptidyl-prolyl cis-trans isomerase C